MGQSPMKLWVLYAEDLWKCYSWCQLWTDYNLQTPVLILINCLSRYLIIISSYLAPCVLSALVFHAILNHFNFKIRAKWQYCHCFCSYYARCSKWQWSLKKLLFQTKKNARNAKIIYQARVQKSKNRKKLTKDNKNMNQIQLLCLFSAITVWQIVSE